MPCGSEFIGGIRIPSEATSYKTLIKELDGLEGKALQHKLSEKGNFSLEAKAGDVVLLPSGFVYVGWSQNGSVVFRVSVSPPFECEDARVKCTVAMLLEAHPELQQTAWNDWHGFLLGQR